MITAILLDWLNDGALPLYPIPPETEAWNLDEDLFWTQVRGRIRPHRLLVALNIDTTLADLETDLLGSLIEGLLGLVEPQTAAVDGTLIFAIRSLFQLDGVCFTVAGMAFVRGTIAEATPLGQANPAALIMECLRGQAGQDANALHPAILASLSQRLRQREEAETRRRLDTEAAERSKRLLEDFLNPEQLSEFRSSQTFRLTLGDGRQFKVGPGFGHNVQLLDDQGEKVKTYCIISRDPVPLYDQMLAQKVLLEGDPESFFRIANHSDAPPNPNNPFAEALMDQNNPVIDLDQ